MAKQIGIHQIQGKIGGRSYYRQSGVKDGLSRSINPAMSGRVKTSEEYANTRRNNAEFGSACQIAGVLGHIVQPKWRPMFLTFSQSKLAKAALNLIKQDTTSGTTWGTRGIKESGIPVMLQNLNWLAKNPFSDYISNVTLAAGSNPPAGRAIVNATIEFVENLGEKLDGINADGLMLYTAVFTNSFGRYDGNTGQYHDCQQIPMGFAALYDTQLEANVLPTTYSPRSLTPTDLDLAFDSFALVAVPYRLINDEKFELQEYASFSSMVMDLA